eukprot:gnl/TRDRNA2_/TRDRNA2_199557_c0_seq1.p1 gnl/TRDRNA2_/TRDRNA2_199557_c0~~gnl/TRDRNA2_/TRDRNA2_199557_c0_seq1.p1  ORF type:complete len:430 (+),score=55.87 gnl/TRDRNA2_/TRDRNA2_199557_c0_seq1:100-1389(+)
MDSKFIQLADSRSASLNATRWWRSGIVRAVSLMVAVVTSVAFVVHLHGQDSANSSVDGPGEYATRSANQGHEVHQDLDVTTLGAAGLLDMPKSRMSPLSALHTLATSGSRHFTHLTGQPRPVPAAAAPELSHKSSQAASWHRPSASVRSPVAARAGANFPRDYGDVTIQTQRAVKAAMKDGITLMEVEFPPISLLSVPGDGEGGVEMDESSGHIRQIVRGFDTKSRVLFPDIADEARQTSTGGAAGKRPFADGKYRTGHLTTPGALMDFGINMDKKVAGRCKDDDAMYVVAYPHFNPAEMVAVGELYEDLTKANGVPIVTVNGEIDRIRTGYYPALFYPRLGKLNKEFIPLMETVYYIRNFKGSYPGALFRCYPGPWQVLRRDGMDLFLPPIVVEEFEEMPSLSDVQEILRRTQYSAKSGSGSGGFSGF